MHKCPPSFSYDQADLPQYPQVLGHGRLGNLQFLGQRPHTQECLAVAVATTKNKGLIHKQLHKAQSGGVGQSFEQVSQYIEIFFHISSY